MTVTKRVHFKVFNKLLEGGVAVDQGVDAAGFQGEDLVGDGGGEVALVGGDEDGAVGGAEAGEELDQLLDAFYIHVGEGLVEEEEFGLGEQDAGEGSALAHALGVLAEGAGQGWVEADLAE